MATQDVHLTCGTRFYIEDVAGSGTMMEIEDVLGYGGEIGEVGTFLESTTTSDCSKTYIAGLPDAPDLTVAFYYSPTSNQTNFRGAAIAREKRAARIVFSEHGNGPAATVEFDFTMGGFTTSDPEPDTILTGNVSGKASNFVWS